MRRRPSLAPAAVAVALLLLLPLAAGAQDLDDARAEAEAVQDELAEATARYERTWAQVEAAKVELEELEAQQAELERRAEELEDRLAARAREAFKHGATAGIAAMLSAEGPDAAIERGAFFATIQERETAGLQEAVAVRASLDRTRTLVEERQRSLESLTAELSQLQGQLEDRLERAQAEVRRLELQAERQREISTGSQQGIYACPMDPAITHFIDSWGFPRSGGRSHKGTDVMGPMGAEVYAFTSGVISRHSNSRLGGISLYLRGDDGSTYFYTHLQGYAPAGAVGNRVEAGDHIAYNGDTGNARGGPPHIHFERHPGGGAAVNPYPYLAAACF
jgi:murein DD-endopeptidase MepM/ murein hydrolase activator NlpD